ncbi:hypothetical protein BDQ12DRAFT_646303 [Crucibulum laeve]|uniref:Uncharacterized protein n=1 Tax=Crucibulum laeve TaxID=68775 RepID=A0A5C3MCX3_9AGAR|nr:hypothetical protein BDQ12DRAFT_646303 [Crucibulum laeve]
MENVVNQTLGLTPKGSHPVRITSSGKIQSYVTAALQFFEKDDNCALVLHTLPYTAAPTEKPSTTSGDSNMNDHTSSVPTKTSTNTHSQSTSTSPKLISVVEIIKREFMKSLEAKHSSRLEGLHQYNQIGYLEELERKDGTVTVNGDSGEENRARNVIKALEGRNHVKQKQTPYMKIILSMKELPELVQSGATYQSPSKRKLSKSARARAKKREKKASEGTAEGEDDAKNATKKPADGAAMDI